MNKNEWIDHLDKWKEFLQGYLSELDDKGEITKVERQLRTLERTRCAAVLNPHLISSFINANQRHNENPVHLNIANLSLNASQLKAVEASLGSEDLSLIKGPPGTGKTQVICELCLQLFEQNPDVRILVCSETHVAVNNLLSRLSDFNKNIRIVRIRDKEDDESVDKHSPENIINTYLNWAKDNSFNPDVLEILERELSNYEDRSLEKALILSANVSGMTCNRVASYDFRDSTEMFDVAIIDEVCKATLPEILAPLIISRKAVLIGDPQQLPPIFCSEELNVINRIEGCNLNRYTYIDELLNTSEEVILLDTQYRMTTEISDMISHMFYNDILKDGRRISLENSLVWIDYQPPHAWPIISEDDSKPEIYNDDECRIIGSIIEDITRNDNESKIAVIAPYKAQVRHLKKCLKNQERVTIDTVDGFQGKEADIIVFSCTRTCGSFRFLADPRRINVTISRAKNKIIIVGNADYLLKNELMNTISRYFDINPQ